MSPNLRLFHVEVGLRPTRDLHHYHDKPQGGILNPDDAFTELPIETEITLSMSR